MKARVSGLFFLVALFISALGVWGQGKSAAVIEFSSGDDVVVIRSGKRVSTSDPIGLELFQGDQIQTGRGVFVELRLSTGGALIKLAENTTFVLERLSGGETSLRLVYGRIRAKVEKLAGTDSFSVSSTQAVAGVRGTDFGLDVVVAKSSTGGTTSTQAYCFEGAVEVIAYVRSDALAAESLEAIPRTFMINAGEMIKVEGEAGTTEASKSVIEKNIQEFWKANDYQSELQNSLTGPLVAAQAETKVDVPLPITPVVDEKRIFEEGYAAGFDAARSTYELPADFVPEGFITVAEAARIRKSAQFRMGGLLSGGLIAAGGAAMSIRGVIQLGYGDTDAGITSLSAGAVISASAIPLLILSMMVRP
jgi:hypothetical protein